MAVEGTSVVEGTSAAADSSAEVRTVVAVAVVEVENYMLEVVEHYVRYWTNWFP